MFIISLGLRQSQSGCPVSAVGRHIPQWLLMLAYLAFFSGPDVRQGAYLKSFKWPLTEG